MSRPQMADSPELPVIIVNGRQQREVIADAWDALLGSEHGDALFLYGGRLVRLSRTRRGAATAETVSTDLLTALLRRSASWLREKDGDGHVDTPVPRDIALDMLALPSPAVPVLERILRTPALGLDGAVLRSDGYHPAHRAFLDLPQILADLPTTPMPLPQAVTWLRDELLADFPFVAETDRTHAVAALLLPFVRPAIDGPTPLHLVEAPTEGTGKSLLADVIVRVTSGHSSQPTTIPRGDDATRKKVTAILAEAPAAVVLDNLAGLVDSASLAAVLTATTWADRRLGETQMLALPNHALWIATGNNPLLSREIAGAPFGFAWTPGRPRRGPGGPTATRTSPAGPTPTDASWSTLPSGWCRHGSTQGSPSRSGRWGRSSRGRGWWAGS